MKAASHILFHVLCSARNILLTAGEGMEADTFDLNQTEQDQHQYPITFPAIPPGTQAAFYLLLFLRQTRNVTHVLVERV